MPALSIVLDGDGCWPDLHEKNTDHWQHQAQLSVARLVSGMQSGKSSVAVRVDLPDGRAYVVETSMSLFLAAADAFRARDQMEQEAATGGPKQ